MAAPTLSVTPGVGGTVQTLAAAMALQENSPTIGIAANQILTVSQSGQWVVTSQSDPIAPVVSTSLQNALVLKNSAGSAMWAKMALTGSVGGWFVLVNSATIPTGGANLSGLILDFQAVDPSVGTGSASLSYDSANPLLASGGIVALFTTAASPLTYTPPGSGVCLFAGQVI